MSLDVYLEFDEQFDAPLETDRCIPVREDGQTKLLTYAEWHERHPDRIPVVPTVCRPDGDVYWANITHNLNKMAEEAGIYECLWRPDEIGITKAEQLIEPLRKGLALLSSEPERFTPFNPKNGWGNYDGLVVFVTQYLSACEQWPQATVRVSR